LLRGTKVYALGVLFQLLPTRQTVVAADDVLEIGEIIERRVGDGKKGATALLGIGFPCR
jgi:hypothetical protein